MFNLEWQNSYLVGDALIDSEHKRLFEIARHAKEVVEPSMRKQKVKDEVKNIYDYSKTHFKHEEEYMEHIQYPDIEDHKKEHYHIIELMNVFMKKMPTLSIIELEKELSYFIETTIVGHILLKDKKIAIWRHQHENIKYKIEFKTEYIVGNEQIDNEHKKLFEIATNFFKDYENNLIKMKTIKATLKELSEYIKFHFNHEEEFMDELPYKIFVNRHKKLHKDIIEQFHDLILKIPDLNMDAIERELIHFIEISLIHHIVVEDKKIIEYQEKIYSLEDI